jgi:hypothetical protein
MRNNRYHYSDWTEEELRTFFQPKRALDAQVAEEFFGWKLVRGPSRKMNQIFQESYWKDINVNTEMLTPDDSFLPNIPKSVPRYSANVNRALEIVKAIELNPEYKFWWGSFGLHKAGNEWYATWADQVCDMRMSPPIVYDRNPATAICLACLSLCHRKNEEES